MLFVKFFCFLIGIYCLSKAIDVYKQKKSAEVLVEIQPFEKSEE